MSNTIKSPNNIKELFQNFDNNETCVKHYEQIKWNGKPVCPHCGNEKHYILKNSKYFKCANKECYKRFNVFTGTIFENSKIEFRLWYIAIYLCTNHKKGVSSCQLARDLNITQKTAWFILSRIREMLKDKAPIMLEGNVQVDETYVGGKAHNKHKSLYTKLYKEKNVRGRPTDKAVVIGLIETKGKVVTVQVPKPTKANIFPLIQKHVKKDSIMVTDEFKIYTNITKEINYEHKKVNHSLGQYVRDGFHTNSIEGYFSQLKRGIYGVYHQVSPKHLHRYCDEFSFRHNTRKISQCERFSIALGQADSRLKYFELIKD